MTKDELKVKATEITTKVKTQISTLVERWKALALWKRALIIGSACLLLLGANDLGFYVAGTQTCKNESQKPITITEAQKPKEKTVYLVTPKEKAIQCGEKIDLNLTLEKKTQLKIEASDKCKKTTKYYDIEQDCQLKRNSLGFGPSVLVTYTDGKINPLVGGRIEYIRWFGNVGFGGSVAGYTSIDRTKYAGSADALIKFRW